MTQNAPDLRQVLKGYDSTITRRTLARDINKTTENKHHYLIRNLRFIMKKDKYSHHNTDLDEYQTQFQDD